MSVATSKPTSSGTQPGRRGHPLWLTVVVGLLALVVGIGAGFLASGTDDQTTAQEVPAEVDQFIDDWLAAWGSGDMDAILALMTTNAVFDGHRVADVGPAGFVGHYDRYVDENNAYRLIDVIVADNPDATHPGAPYAVAYEFGFGFDDAGGVQDAFFEDATAVELLYLVEEDGVLKVSQGEQV
jgi:hypothetical protein